MNIDLIFFDNEILISKEHRPAKIWREKLYYFKTSFSFKSKEELLDYVKILLKINNESDLVISNYLSKYGIGFILIKPNKEKEGQVEIKNTTISILNNKGSLVYWEDWDWILKKVKNDYYLSVYFGGLADTWRTIILSQEQIKKFLVERVTYIKSLSNELLKYESIVFEDAVRENRIPK